MPMLIRRMPPEAAAMTYNMMVVTLSEYSFVSDRYEGSIRVGKVRGSMTVSNAVGFVLPGTRRVTTFNEIRALSFRVQAGGL